jgi:hypothetical protein
VLANKFYKREAVPAEAVGVTAPQRSATTEDAVAKAPVS